jgi:hypothetical protein
MSTTTATMYTVERFFNGERKSAASSHRTLAAAEKAAAKLNRSFGSNGWGARIYLGDLRIDE